MNNLTTLSLTETLKLLEERKVSEEELWQAYLDRIEELNEQLGAYLVVNKHPKGVPAAIKDVIVTKDIVTTASSKILEKFTPPYNATVISRILEQNVGIIGKTNCDEFAMGSSGENSAYKVARNPWNFGKVPGGSSSGSACAVAADLCAFALGTDTGGSIRQPASFCGVVGLKPSYGRVSRYGAIAMASSFDQIGPITKTVADARQVLEWISGEDGFDSNCINGAVLKARPCSTARPGLIQGLKVGVPGEYFASPAGLSDGSHGRQGKGLDQGVEKIVRDAIGKLEELGAEIVEINLPHTEYAIAAYYVLITSEISSNFARYDEIRFGGSRDLFGSEVKRRIMLGTYALSSGYYDDFYIKAAKVRTLIKQDFNKAFQKCDVIVGPVSPTVAWDLGDKIKDPLTMYLSDVYTVPASLAGIPGLSVPCGFSGGLPVGLQILGKYMDEETILKVGEVYEQATEWHKMKPKIGGNK